MTKQIVAILPLLLICLSCSRGTNSDGSPAVSEASKTDVVVLKLGTNLLTRAEIDRMVDLRVKVVENQTLQQVKKLRGQWKVNRSAVETTFLARVEDMFKSQSVLADWAASNGVSVTVADMAPYANALLASIGCKGQNFGKWLSRANPDMARTAMGRVCAEATAGKVKKVFLEESSIGIAKEEVDAFLERLTAYNKMAAETNALVFARATNIWNRIVAGEDFAALADAFNEDPALGPGGEWGEFRIEDLGPDAILGDVLKAMAPGDVTPPIETDAGVSIVKLIQAIDADDVPAQTRDDATRYELARIFLRLAETYEVPPPDQTEREMTRFVEDKAFSKFLGELMKSATLEYPCGRDLFIRAKEAAKMPQMLVIRTSEASGKNARGKIKGKGK